MPYLNPPPIDRVILLQSPPPNEFHDEAPSIVEAAPDHSNPVAFAKNPGSERIVFNSQYSHVPIIVIDPAK